MQEQSPQFIYTEELYNLPGRVIVLLPVPWVTLSEDQITLLGKILGSVRLSLSSVQILCHEKINSMDLKVYNPSAIISFGTILYPTIESYTAGEVEGIRVIQSDTLDLLDEVKKKSLWNALKQAFG